MARHCLREVKVNFSMSSSVPRFNVFYQSMSPSPRGGCVPPSLPFAEKGFPAFSSLLSFVFRIFCQMACLLSFAVRSVGGKSDRTIVESANMVLYAEMVLSVAFL